MRKTLQTALVLLASCTLTTAQVISTVAGKSTGGFSGDGGLATAAELNGPEMVFFDAGGNYYVPDENNGSVRMVNPSGIISTVVGHGVSGYSGDGGLATAAELSNPIGVAVDGAGKIYVSDMSNERIRMVNTSGIITALAGNGSPGFSGDGGQATAAEVNTPRFITLDATSANLYIADQGNNRVRKINLSTGIISTIAGTGVGGYGGDGGQATAAQLNQPYGVTFNQSGELLIADQGNSRIRKIDLSGNISTVAGNGTAGYSGDGGQATAAELNGPSGITVGPAGDLMISDTYGQRVRFVSHWNGVITTIAGNGTAGYTGDGGQATTAEIHFPSGIGCDAAGNLYVAVWGNNAVRKITNSDVNTGFAAVQNENGISIYPNPASNEINIAFVSYKGDVLLSLYNVMGQEVYNKVIKDNNVATIPVSSLSNGIYLVKVSMADGQVVTKKVEVNR